jgi:hypothetical protein
VAVPVGTSGWRADRIGEWASLGRDVLAYFNNDGYGHALRNALRLGQLVVAPAISGHRPDAVHGLLSAAAPQAGRP